MALDWKKIAKPASTVEGFKGAVRAQKTAAEVVAAAIDKQIELFKAPRSEGRRWFEVKGDQVGFVIRYANSPLKLVGTESKLVVPKDQFVEVLTAIKADVVKGSFKDQLEAGEAKVRQRSASMVAKKAATKTQA
ncbi:hypothetical protein [Novosphingobium guangzhouense]|uniref:Uncharacterized protein n=1 Tax=Novosphingobium guangzhouense TaxID=1850347 RepID=A0A2K2G0R7_9SPHN|nr:hypothetical protein [Novosphingobium guangzhouense]PNU04592.1 hypothetical protein A8V01_19480 [Novosphingobium guangzhouense]